MNTDDAMNALSALRTTRQNEIDAIDLAVSLLNNTWQGQYTELETAKGQITDLTTNLETANTDLEAANSNIATLEQQNASLQTQVDTANVSLAALQTDTTTQTDTVVTP